MDSNLREGITSVFANGNLNTFTINVILACNEHNSILGKQDRFTLINKDRVLMPDINQRIHIDIDWSVVLTSTL